LTTKTVHIVSFTELLSHSRRSVEVNKVSHLLGDLVEATGSSGVEGGPALAVRCVYVGAVFREKLHHVQVVVYTCLEAETVILRFTNTSSMHGS